MQSSLSDNLHTTTADDACSSSGHVLAPSRSAVDSRSSSKDGILSSPTLDCRTHPCVRRGISFCSTYQVLIVITNLADATARLLVLRPWWAGGFPNDKPKPNEDGDEFLACVV